MAEGRVHRYQNVMGDNNLCDTERREMEKWKKKKRNIYMEKCETATNETKIIICERVRLTTGNEQQINVINLNKYDM